MCVVTSLSPLASQEKNADPPNAAVAPPPSADVITVPDGKPVVTQLTKSLATATAKVGDVVELTVTHAVLQDDLVIIPRGAVLSAKITSVRHAGRPLKDGRVSFSVENAVLPSGEIVALRPEPLATAGQRFHQTLKGMGDMATEPELPPGFGVAVLAVGGPIMLFVKGHERVITPGHLTTLYLHGPVTLKREAVLQMQPPPYKGPSQVFYTNRAYGKDPDLHVAFYCGRKYLRDVHANQIVKLELNPGAYWLSTGKDLKEKVHLEVAANHRYHVERDAQGLFIKNFDNTPYLLEGSVVTNNFIFTSTSPEVTADLLAIPFSVDATQKSHYLWP
jgi:hypothetical protein